MAGIVVSAAGLVFETKAAAQGTRVYVEYLACRAVFEDAGLGKTRYVGRAMHWTPEARKEHEDMGFHEGWGKAADQLEALARSL